MLRERQQVKLEQEKPPQERRYTKHAKPEGGEGDEINILQAYS